MQPEQLGPYRIGRVLGRGGMGAVYEGIHEQTGEAVAVKVLLSTLEEDEDIRRRFEAEIDTLKRLRHPNIVRLFGFGDESGMLYYVMELVDGSSLHQEMRRKRVFQWHEVAKIGLEMSFALKHAHDRGITHRDIKPANILLEQGGAIKLSDFGIAQFFGSQRLTEIHSIVGTLEYMSPEQALAQPVGPKSDIYSLGAVLYCLVVGKPPFSARNLIEIVRKHQSGTLEPFKVSRPDVPDELEAIVFDLLKMRPEDRPHNMYLIAKRFQSLLQALVGPPERITVKPTLSTSPVDGPVSPERNARDKTESSPGNAKKGGIIDLAGLGEDLLEPSKDAPKKLLPSSPPGGTSLAHSFGLPGEIQNPTREYEQGASDLLRDDSTLFSISPESASAEFEDRRSPADENRSQAGSRPGPSDNKTRIHSSKELTLPESITAGESRESDEDANEFHSGSESATSSLSPLRSPKAEPDNSRQEEPTVSGLKKSPQIRAIPVEVERDSSPCYEIRESEVRRDVPTSFGGLSPQTEQEGTTSRFVKVDDREYDDYEESAQQRRPVVSLQTILASISLILIGFIVRYFLQPVSPEVLYGRIEKTLDISGPGKSPEGAGEGNVDELSPRALRQAADDIDRFLKHYTNHPKADTVRYFEDQLELANKERDLERRLQFSGSRKLISVERAYLEAIATAKTDPERTIKKLRALIDLYGPRASDPEQSEPKDAPAEKRFRRRLSQSEQCVEVARQRLKKLENDLSAIHADQVKYLKERLELADQLEHERPERAQAIRRGFIELYQDHAWAEALVRQAREKMESSSEKPDESP